MTTIKLSGYYYRTKCCFCRVEVLHRNPRLVTCSSWCRQQRCRAATEPRPCEKESLGFLLAGQKVRGKLAELCA